jgi:hypothetical protein
MESAVSYVCFTGSTMRRLLIMHADAGNGVYQPIYQAPGAYYGATGA